MSGPVRGRGDAHQDAGVHELDGPLAFTPLTREEIRELAGIKRRQALLASPVYERLAERLFEVTYAVIHQPAPAPPPGPVNPDRVRVATWNIERGIELDGIKAYLAGHKELLSADILMLNEVDVGMSRSGNRDVAGEIAELLGFNMVFGNSYLCLDEGDSRDEQFASDANRESLHGNAILSRHPITRAEDISVTVSKDKYHSGDRRLGHKKSLWAEVQTHLGPLPVVSVHLDVICSVEVREAEMEDIMQKVSQRGLRDRVLLGGDFNTTTYDIQTIPRLLWNLTKKLFRGGFPHGVHHYMRPYDLYEKPVFDVLDRHQVEWRAFNAMDQETSRYEVGEFESESKVRDHLPRFAVDLLRYKLRPWDGVTPLKLDWFAGRGLQPSGQRVFHRPRWDGRSLSDHDPVMVDVRF